MGPFVKYIGKVGSHTKGAGDVFQGGCTGGSYFWSGVVGYDPPHRQALGGSSTGLRKKYVETTTVASQWDLGISSTRDGDEGSGIQRDGGGVVLKRNKTVLQYISMQPIMDLYEDRVRMPGTWVKNVVETGGPGTGKSTVSGGGSRGRGERIEQDKDIEEDRAGN